MEYRINTLMKGTILKLLRVTGAFAPFRWAHRHQALIITYHRFSEREGGARISARAFAEQVEYLAAHYTVVPLSRLATCLRKREIPPRLAAITIDDGYRDAYEIAFPILRKHCAPATVFVVTEFVEGTTWLWTDKARYVAATAAAARAFEIGIGGRDLRLELNGAASRAVAAGLINAALKPLSEEARDALIERLAFDLGVKLPGRPPAEYGAINWRQAREMADAGVEIGSHTLTHPILTGLGDARLREEVAQSRDRIYNAIGREVETFCYPNGDYDLRTQLEVARAGYQFAVTTDVGLNDGRNDPLALRRIHGEYDLARFVKNTSGFRTTALS